MTTDTKLNQLIINKLTQEQYDEAKAAGTLSDTELYITDSDDEALTNNNITNCITEIPQDIKLELNNVTLTLKAGSKVYVPNGFEADGTTPKFDVKIIESDIIVDSPYADEPMFIYYVDNTVVPVPSSAQCSGTSNPIIDGYSCCYDTTNNIIKITFGDEVGYSGMSLPLAIVNGTSNGDWTSIDQVFNGFGYIGSTVFALPGVKGLIPNGRNADGSLKNIEFTLDKVLTFTNTVNNTPNIFLLGNTSEFNSFLNISEFIGYFDYAPVPSGTYGSYFNTKENQMYFYYGNKWNKTNRVLCGSLSFTDLRISYFNPKTVFHALDYNDSSRIVSIMNSQYSNLLSTLYPVGSIYIGTQNSCPLATLIAGSQWQIVGSGRALWGGNGSNANSTIDAGLPNITGDFSPTGLANIANSNGCFSTISNVDTDYAQGVRTGHGARIRFNASSSSTIYGKSNTVQPPAYIVNVWRRTA